MNKRYGAGLLSGLFCLLVSLVPSLTGVAKAQVTGTTVGSAYPGLASGMLTGARLEDLPDGVLLRAEVIEITSGDLDSEVPEHPTSLQAEPKKNGFFLIE